MPSLIGGIRLGLREDGHVQETENRGQDHSHFETIGIQGVSGTRCGNVMMMAMEVVGRVHVPPITS